MGLNFDVDGKHEKIFLFQVNSNNVIHFNLNLVLFALVSHAPSGNSIIYATVNKAVKHYKGIYSLKQNHMYGTNNCNTLPIEEKTLISKSNRKHKTA